MIKALIVDDDAMSRAHLKHLCAQTGQIAVIEVLPSALEVKRFLDDPAYEVDVVFLDVEMPDFSGIDLLRSVQDLPWIIFTTSKKEYAADAFEYRDRVIDYLTKPLTLPRLMSALDRLPKVEVANIQLGAMRDVFVKVNGKLVKIPLDELNFIETLGDYVVFHTEKKKYVVYSTLKRIDEQITHPDFMKIHRSYIINLNRIVDIQDGSVVIGDKVIPVSRAHRADLLSRINVLE